MKRCVRCIIPSSVPGVTFNEEGLCNYCQSYENEKYLGKEKLDEIIKSAVRGNRGKYDCIVPVSGGRDSTYVLYVAKKIYNLKILAVNYDNEFRIEQAFINLKRACEILDVDLLPVRSKRNIATKIVRNAIRLNSPMGLDAIVAVLCIACAFGYKSVVYREAEKYKVPMILWGESKAEATGEMEAQAFQAAQINTAGTQKRMSKLKKMFNINYDRTMYYRFLQRLEFRVPGNSLFSMQFPRLKNSNIQEIRLFDFITWDRHVIKETITKELDWKKPADHVSTWRTDCDLHPLLHYCYLNHLGCSKMCFGYTNMINSGKMNREDALQQEECLVSRFTDEIRKLLKEKVGLTSKEIRIIESYTDSTGNILPQR